MIVLSDIQSPERYGAIRSAYRRALRAHKAPRRIDLGEDIGLFFESPWTVLAQIREVCFIEGRRTPAAIQREIDEYSDLLPTHGRLTATLTIHGGSAADGLQLSTLLREGPGPLSIDCLDGAGQVLARLRSRALRPWDMGFDPVHYLAFDADPAQRDALARAQRVRLGLRSAAGEIQHIAPPSLVEVMRETTTLIPPLPIHPPLHPKLGSSSLPRASANPSASLCRGRGPDRITAKWGSEPRG